MKILYISHRAENRGTAINHVREVLSALRKRGHEVTAPNFREESQVSSSRGRVKRAVRFPLKSELALAKMFLAEIWLYRRIPTGKCDVVYSRHRWLNLPEMICGKPYVREVNGFVADEMRIRGGWSRFLLWLVEKVERWNIRKADRWIAVTDEIKVTLCEKYGVSKKKVAVVTNGVNVELFCPEPLDAEIDEWGVEEADTDDEELDEIVSDVATACIMGVTMSVPAKILRAQQGKPDIKYTIGFSGNIWEHQQLDKVLNATPLIRNDTALQVIGDGPQRNALQKICQNADHDVAFLGSMSQDMLVWYLQQVDVCLGPFFEGDYAKRIGRSALKLYEYLACGKPVVCSRARNTEFVEREGLGIVVDDLKPETIAGAVNWLLERPELREMMGKKARKWAVENASWDVVAGKIEKVMEEVRNE